MKSSKIEVDIVSDTFNNATTTNNNNDDNTPASTVTAIANH